MSCERDASLVWCVGMRSECDGYRTKLDIGARFHSGQGANAAWWGIVAAGSICFNPLFWK